MASDESVGRLWIDCLLSAKAAPVMTQRDNAGLQIPKRASNNSVATESESVMAC